MKFTNNIKKYSVQIYLMLLLVGITLFLTACAKEHEDMDYYKPSGPLVATLDQSKVTAGTPLMLSFTGTADSIFFYSGKEGHKYEYRNRSENEDIEITLSFTSTIRYGYQENTIQLLLSTDFIGDDFSPEAVNAATWQDITHLSTWATTWPDKTPSGSIDLTPFHVTGKPIFIAFRFLGQGGTTQRDWGIENYYIRESSPTAGVDNELINVVTADWTSVAMLNPDPARNWRMRNPTELHISGGNASFPDQDAWAISKPIYVSRVSPDRPEVIKTKHQLMFKNYRFVYDEPGAYKPTVVGKSGQEEFVSELDVVVE